MMRHFVFTMLLLPSACWAGSTEVDCCVVNKTVVDNARLTSDPSGAHWAGYGRTFDEQRFSPLAQVNADNVNNLSLAS